MVRPASLEFQPLAISRAVLRDVTLRGVWLWVGGRFIYLIAVYLSAQQSAQDPEIEPLPILGPIAALIVTGFVALFARLDLRICRETLLFANLGIPPRWITATAWVAIPFEIVINLVVHFGPTILQLFGPASS